MSLNHDEPLTQSVTAAIRAGDTDELRRLLAHNPGIAEMRIRERTLLHIATDWPGHHPRCAETIAILVQAGTDVNARMEGPHRETPLHWAASCDDVEALDALVNAGADLEADGAVIGGGTPMADAVAFGQWNAARRLVERGARTSLWQAAALGLVDRVRGQLTTEAATPDEITGAFWCACHGGQRDTAELLASRGADLNRIGWDGLTPMDAARRSGAEILVKWLRQLGCQTADEVAPRSSSNQR